MRVDTSYPRRAHPAKYAGCALWASPSCHALPARLVVWLPPSVIDLSRPASRGRKSPGGCFCRWTESSPHSASRRARASRSGREESLRACSRSSLAFANDLRFPHGLQLGSSDAVRESLAGRGRPGVRVGRRSSKAPTRRSAASRWSRGPGPPPRRRGAEPTSRRVSQPNPDRW